MTLERPLARVAFNTCLALGWLAQCVIRLFSVDPDADLYVPFSKPQMRESTHLIATAGLWRRIIRETDEPGERAAYGRAKRSQIRPEKAHFERCNR